MIYFAIIWVLLWVVTNAFFQTRNCRRHQKLSNSIEDKKHYIDDFIFQDIESTLMNAIGTMAISTSAYYCDELQKHGFSSNIVSKNWMLGHKEYKDKGFNTDLSAANSDGSNSIDRNSQSSLISSSNSDSNMETYSCEWRKYIDSMITIDPLEIKVITSASKGMFPEGSSMRMKYMQKIEPRKIAYKLVQITETITKELLVDLGTVDNEHSEASRYSSVYIAEGKDVADKSRKPVRLHFEDNDENGSPFREKNWSQIGFLITKIALNLVKLDYQRSPGSCKAELDKLNRQIDATFQPLSADPNRRSRQEIQITRQILESLFIESLIGVTPLSSSPSQPIVNTRVIAEALVQKRLFVASLIRRILLAEDQYLRLQYKKITDLGGYTKLDMGKRPKYELIDLTMELKGAELKDKILKKTPIERLSYSIATIMTSEGDTSTEMDSDHLESQNSDSTVNYSDSVDMMIIPMPGCEDYANIMFL